MKAESGSPAALREAEARWLRLRWACSGGDVQAAAVLRLIVSAELTMDSRLRRSAAA